MVCHIALQRLKDKFGGKKGMSTKNKKEADKIIRESLKGNPMQMYPQPQQFQNFPTMPHMAMPFPMAPFAQPQLPFAPQQQINPMRGTNGPCFTCQQFGHIARNCPNAQQNQRGGGHFRRAGRGNFGRKYQNKKKN